MNKKQKQTTKAEQRRADEQELRALIAKALDPRKP
jgi:hypothetical protein